MNGTVVNSGQTFAVTVAASASAFSSIAILTDSALTVSGALAAPPYQFQVQIPPDVASGPYALGAVGVVQPGSVLYSDPVSIDIERSDAPLQLTANLPILTLDYVGDNIRLLVDGLFADGSTVNLTRSTKTTYTPNAPYQPPVVAVDSQGLVTAVGPGWGTITITNAGSTAYVFVYVRQPVIVAPSWMILYPSGTQQFDALLSNASGDTSVTWSVTPGVGSIDGTGRYTAPAVISTTQIVTITATRIADSTQSATARVWIYPGETVVVNPSTASLGPSQTQAFFAVVAGSPRGTSSVQWTVTPAGLGTVDSTGLYTAPASIGSTQTAVVTAASADDSTKTAFGQVTLTPAAPGPPVASISPGAVTFASQTIGVTSAPQNVILSNSGAGLLIVAGIVATGDFGRTDNCPVGLAAGANCTINITFTPTASGARAGTLTITDNSNNAAVITQTVTLSGTGNVLGGETVSTPATPTGPPSGVSGTLYQFTASGSTSSLGHTIQYSFNWGDGSFSGWTPQGVTSSFHTWSSPGTYTVTVQARCTIDTSIVSTVSAGLLLTIAGESISTPSTPTGVGSGVTGTSYTYSTGGAVSSLGHQVQYKFFWGDGSVSGWLPVGTTTASYAWFGPGTQTVTVQARCATDTQVLSSLSGGLAVNIAAGETISAPATPSGPVTGVVGTTYTYSTGGATSSTGSPVVYLFDWGDGKTSGWLAAGATSAAHTWTTAGSYQVTAYAADGTNLLIQSSGSSALVVSIQ